MHHAAMRLIRHRQRGWTLVELLVAMTLGLLLIAGIGQIYLAAKHSYNVQASTARIQDVGRYVTEELTRDIRLAGYWGLMDMRRLAVQDSSGEDYPTGIVDPPDTTCPTANADWGRSITQAVYGLDNVLQSSTAYACLNNRNLDGRDMLVVRYAAPTPLPPINPVSGHRNVSAIDPDRLYVRTAPYEASVVFGDPASPNPSPPSPDPVLTNSVGDPVANNGNYDYAVVARAYYVASSSATECGDPDKPALPALWREELDSSGRPSGHELVTGVENLQFDYLEKVSGNFRYKSASGVNDWSNVVAVRFRVLVRNDCPDSTYTDNTTYYLDPNEAGFQPNDHYRRALYTSTVALRNN